MAQDGLQYLDLGGTGTLSKTFTLSEQSLVDVSGWFSRRELASGTVKIDILDSSNNVVFSTTSVDLAGASRNTWYLSQAYGQSLAAGTYTLRIQLPNNLNVDNIRVCASRDSDGDGKADRLDLSRRGLLVEKYRKIGFLCDSLSHSLRQFNALFGSGFLDRDERHYINTTHSWVPAFMFRQIDQLNCFLCQLDTRFFTSFRTSHICDNGSVVRFIRGVIEQCTSGCISDLIHTCFDNFLISAFTDVRYAFDNLCHISSYYNKTSIFLYQGLKTA